MVPPTDHTATLVRQFDAIAATCPHVDRFCTSTCWGLPAHAAFSSPGSIPLLHVRDSFAAMFSLHRAGMRRCIACPLDSAWMLGSPFVAPEARTLVDGALDVLDTTADRWHTFVLGGIRADTLGQAFDDLERALSRSYSLRRISPQERRVASLDGGLDGYLSRRSGGFRTSLRAQQRRARERGASFRRTLARTTDEVNDLLRACHGVEVRTWKAAEGMGVDQGAARTFQHGVMRRAADLGLEARAVVMELDGADVAYVNGVVGPEGYRGMSLSFDESFRPLGAGNLVQAEMLAWLCDDAVRWYDLGGTLPYKERWGEIGLSTTGWVVLNDKG